MRAIDAVTLAILALGGAAILSALCSAPKPARAEQTVSYVYDLAQPAIELPQGMAKGIWQVIACESRWRTDAVGKAGELGLLQIHPIHFPSMDKMGLDPYREHDRLTYGAWLWERSGWQPWSCHPNKKGAP